MSYILDALRKSESERHQGEVPNLGANPMLIHARRDERPIWPYVLIGVLALNVIVLVVWLMSGQQNQVQMTATGSAVSSGEHITQRTEQSASQLPVQQQVGNSQSGNYQSSSQA